MTIVFPEENMGGRVAGELAHLTISGRITFVDGRAAVGVSVALVGRTSAVTETDASGAFAFADIGAGGSYALTPTRADLAFTPAALEISAIQSDMTVDFAALSTDVAAPVLVTPASIGVDATGPAGAEVAFVVTATDDFDAAPVVVCEPPSGSVFAIGKTTVRCAATDAVGNRAEAAFEVEVRGPAQQVGSVGEQIGGAVGSATKEAADKLEDANAKAETALAELARGDRQAALGAIEGTVGDLEAAVSAGLLPRAEGEALMTRLAGAARTVAATAIAEAEARGGDAKTIGEANASLADGDARAAGGAYKDAVNKFKDALAKAESAK